MNPEPQGTEEKYEEFENTAGADWLERGPAIPYDASEVDYTASYQEYEFLAYADFTEPEEFLIENRYSPELNTTITATSPGGALAELLDRFRTILEEADELGFPRDRGVDPSRWHLVTDPNKSDYCITFEGDHYYFAYDDLCPTGAPLGDKFLKHSGDWWGVDHALAEETHEAIRSGCESSPSKHTLQR